MWAKRILANSGARDGALLVLLALGETADKDGVTNATVPELEKWTKLHKRAVRRILKGLVAKGELDPHRPAGGRGKAAQYRILVQWDQRFWHPKRKPKRGAAAKPLLHVERVGL